MSVQQLRLECCGGFATKIHAVVYPHGHPVVIELTAAQCANCYQSCGYATTTWEPLELLCST